MARKINRNLRQTTAPERLWLWRRLHGLTQAQAAKRAGVSRNTIQAWETGLREGTPAGVEQAPHASGYALLPLARRRWGRGLVGTAAAVGISHVTLLDWESYGDPRLTDFWQRKGFVF